MDNLLVTFQVDNYDNTRWCVIFYWLWINFISYLVSWRAEMLNIPNFSHRDHETNEQISEDKNQKHKVDVNLMEKLKWTWMEWIGINDEPYLTVAESFCTELLPLKYCCIYFNTCTHTEIWYYYFHVVKHIDTEYHVFWALSWNYMPSDWKLYRHVDEVCFTCMYVSGIIRQEVKTLMFHS